MFHLVSYTAVLPIGEHTVARLCTLLSVERARRGTRQGRRTLDCYAQAVLVLRWFCDGTRVAGHTHVNVDGTLIFITRCRTPGPTVGVDLW